MTLQGTRRMTYEGYFNQKLNNTSPFGPYKSYPRPGNYSKIQYELNET